MKKIYILLFIILISASLNIWQYKYFNSVIESKISKGDYYIGKWKQIGPADVRFSIKKAGSQNYIVRSDKDKDKDKDKEADLLCRFEDGCFIVEEDNYKLFFTNGDTLESIKKSYIRSK